MSKKGISLTTLSIVVVILLILLSTISISITYSVSNAKKLTFAKEMYNIQSLVDEYIQKNGELPETTSIIQIQPSSVEQFDKESFTNGKILLKVLDLPALDIKNTNYGNAKLGKNNAEKAKDVYAISQTTGRVYYIAGFKSDSVTYYTLTDELLNMVEKKQQFTIGEKMISFVPDKVGWTNQGVFVKVVVPSEYTVNNIAINNANISYTTETIDNIKYYNVNNNKVAENYTITLNYTKNGISGVITYATKLDNTAPVISKDTNIANTETSIKGLNATDDNSGIKSFKYIEGALENNASIKTYMETYGNDINSGSLKFENATVYTLYAEDKAGNYAAMYIAEDGTLTANKP